MAVMEIPTSSSRCSFFCAVTTTSSRSSWENTALHPRWSAKRVVIQVDRVGFIVEISGRVVLPRIRRAPLGRRSEYGIRKRLRHGRVRRTNGHCESVVVRTEENRLSVRVIQKAFECGMTSHTALADAAKWQAWIRGLES